MTGFNMPPGCNPSDIPGVDEGPCEVCFKSVDKCICPECPKCGEQGRMMCYSEAHLSPTKEILIAREEEHLRRLKEQIAETEEQINWWKDPHTVWNPNLYDIEDDGL